MLMLPARRNPTIDPRISITAPVIRFRKTPNIIHQRIKASVTAELSSGLAPEAGNDVRLVRELVLIYFDLHRSDCALLLPLKDLGRARRRATVGHARFSDLIP